MDLWDTNTSFVTHSIVFLQVSHYSVKPANQEEVSGGCSGNTLLSLHIRDLCDCGVLGLFAWDSLLPLDFLAGAQNVRSPCPQQRIHGQVSIYGNHWLKFPRS